MKNLTLLLIFISTLAFSQEENDKKTNHDFDNYNQWFIEFGVGANKAGRTLTNISEPALGISEFANTSTISGLHADLALRYMFNDKFGLRLKGGFNDITEDEDDSTIDFNSTYIQSSLEAVLNMGSILDFQNWTQRFNLQFYGGFGVGLLTTDFDDSDDYTASAVLGFSPMYKISDKVTLKMDFMGIANATQQLNWDGFTQTNNTNAVDGLMLNASIGLNISLGKAEKSIDWYHLDNSEESELVSLREEIDELKDNLSDTDRDGVPDYLDQEPNTVNGVAVNTKGIAVDQNENGIPDELESELDKSYATKSELKKSQSSAQNAFKSLVEDGYVNVYFGFDKVYPEAASINDINSVINFLKQNPNENIQLVGYTDSVGDEAYNKQLSEKRSKYIKDILISAGIAESRIESIGSGVNPNIESDSDYSRRLARKVKIRLK